MLQLAVAKRRVATLPPAHADPGGSPFTGGGLVGRLLSQTGAGHEAMKSHPLVAALKGATPRDAYVQFLSDKAAFYGTLEELLPQHADEPAIAAILQIHGLARTPRILADLQALNAAPHPSTAGQDYAAYLHALAATEPKLLAVHAWLNYLGEMFGGQNFQQALQKTLGPQAVNSFGFDAPVRDLRTKLLHSLDGVVSPAEESACIAEGVQVAEWSLALFNAAQP